MGKMPLPSAAEMRARTRQLFDRAAAVGCTALHDCGIGLFAGPPDLALLKSVMQDKPPIRYRGMLISTAMDGWEKMGIKPGQGDDWFRVDGIKAWSDGSNQAYTGYQRANYLGRDTRGSLNYTPEQLTEAIRRAHRAGWQVGVHANGDAGIDTTLAAFETVLRETPRSDRRHRIEHCSVLHPEQIAKMRGLGISPSFLIGHVRWWGKAFRDRILGTESARFYDPCASALKGGLRISLHSDWNVTPLEPLRYVGDAVTRIMNEGGDVLNVRYVLEGSVQRGGNRLRVNVQLIDAETGNHLWAERFDKPLADLFDMQDEIVSRLANTLNAELIEAEARRSERSRHPNSMDLYFQGRASWNKALTPEAMVRARGFFERALTLDPLNIEAMVGLATIGSVAGTSYMTDERAPYLASAETTAVKVLSYEPNHAFAHLVLGFVQVHTNRAVQGMAECARALALDRNLAEAHTIIGLAKIFLGRGAETEAHINEAFRLSPRDIFVFQWLMVVGFAKLQLEADAEAVDWFHRGIETNRTYPLTHFGHAAALALLGSLDQARAAAKAGLALDPSFTIRRFRDGASSDNPTFLAKRERIYEGMRLAGVPEG
jgi:tetratricopeptide (TPR) repeat protein